MKLETSATPTTELVVEHADLVITCTRWSNLAGVNIIATDNKLHVRFVTAMTWEELDALLTALAAAKTL